MMTADDLTTDSPSCQLGVRSRLRFTGRLDVQIENGQTWSLYLYMGRLIWATGGPHPLRRWLRYLTQYCPQVALRTANLKDSDGLQTPGYHTLTDLVKQQQITGEQAVALIRSTIAEVLFDIIQQEETRPVTFHCDPQDILETSLTVVNADHALQETQQIWNSWCSIGFVDRSPNLAPVLRRPEQLQQQTSAKVYQTLVSVLDGKRTLRDLSTLMKQDLLVLTRSLIPYFRQGLIGLAEIPDLVPAIPSTTQAKPLPLTPPPITTKPAPAVGPLVACIDDSPRECQIMEQILMKAGYRFMGIQDSVQALPMLLERKPDLIFLDLVMPVANGYELCAQIRRVSLFKNTPVVILTSNDGIVDRVRARMVGSSDFLAKPVETEKVLAMARKYVPTRSAPNSVSWSQ